MADPSKLDPELEKKRATVNTAALLIALVLAALIGAAAAIGYTLYRFLDIVQF